MLDTWLSKEVRQTVPACVLEIADVIEIAALSDRVGHHLSELMLSARFDLRFLQSMAQLIGWDGVSGDIINEALPNSVTAKRGDFGEVLVAGILEQFDGYLIPVRKLRFKITSGQSLPATDMLGLKISNDGTIEEVLYIESKLRTTRDVQVAVEGYQQLKHDYDARLPDILTFIAIRLFEQNHPVYTSFRNYLATRRDNKDIDRFCLSLCFDAELWHERVLDKLEDLGIDEPKPKVLVIRLNNLGTLTNTVFALVGISEVLEDG